MLISSCGACMESIYVQYIPTVSQSDEDSLAEHCPLCTSGAVLLTGICFL